MKSTTISIIAAVFIIGGSVIFIYSRPADSPKDADATATVVGGKQIVEIAAKGGYSPRMTLAKANVPTIIKMTTQGTFDCTASLTIPAIDYQTILPPSGATEIEVPPQKPGTTLRGLCAMGMYNFAIRFN